MSLAEGLRLLFPAILKIGGFMAIAIVLGIWIVSWGMQAKYAKK